MHQGSANELARMIVAGLMLWRTGGIRNLPRSCVLCGMGLLNLECPPAPSKADYTHVKTPNPLHHNQDLPGRSTTHDAETLIELGPH